MNRLLTLCLLMFATLAAPAFADAPLNPANPSGFTRTGSLKGQPPGTGCPLTVLSAKTATPIRLFAGGAYARWRLPAQIELTSTSTTTTLLCFSQDPAPTINRYGHFTARANAYAAGQGACAPIPGNMMPTTRVLLSDGMSRTRGNIIGSMPRTCTDGVTPCLANSDCTAGGGSGTCRTTGGPSPIVYGFLVSDSSNPVMVYACDLE